MVEPNKQSEEGFGLNSSKSQQVDVVKMKVFISCSPPKSESIRIRPEDYVFHGRRWSKIKKPRDWTLIMQIDDGIDPCEEIQWRNYELRLFIKMTAKKKKKKKCRESWVDFAETTVFTIVSSIFSANWLGRELQQLHFDSPGHTSRGWNSYPGLIDR